MRVFMGPSRNWQATFNHGGRGEYRIYTSIIKAFLESGDEVNVETNEWKGKGDSPRGLHLNAHRDEKYEAVCGWDVGTAPDRQIDMPGVPIVSYYFGSGLTPGELEKALQNYDALVIALPFKVPSLSLKKCRFLPIPIVEDLCPGFNIDSREVVLTLRGAFSPPVRYGRPEVYLIKRLIDSGFVSIIHIINGFPGEPVSETKKRVLSCFSDDLKTLVEIGRIKIYPNLDQEAVLNILSKCRLSIALHHLSGTKLQSASVGCLPLLFDSGEDGFFLNGAARDISVIHGHPELDNVPECIRNPDLLVQKASLFMKDDLLFIQAIKRVREECRKYSFSNFRKEFWRIAMEVKNGGR